MRIAERVNHQIFERKLRSVFPTEHASFSVVFTFISDVLYASKARIWRVSFAVAHTTAWLEDEHAGSVSRSRGSGLLSKRPDARARLDCLRWRPFEPK